MGLVPGIDMRGDGGCVVAPPSVHASGKSYVWLEGHAPELLALALPGWLLHEVTAGKKRQGHAQEY